MRRLFKIGGSVIYNSIDDFVEQIVIEHDRFPLAIVHGGGPHISAEMKYNNETPLFIDGLRVTSLQMIDIVSRVFAEVNTQLVSSINKKFYQRGKKSFAIGIGPASIFTAQVHPDSRLDRVGVVHKTNSEIINVLCSNGYLPIISPLAIEEGSAQLLNINADYAAAELARDMGVDDFILLSDVPGVYGRDGKVIEKISIQESESLLADGTISAGMIPKINCIKHALEGVKRARICSSISESEAGSQFSAAT